MTKAEALLLLAEMTKPCPIYHSANIEQPCAHSSPHCPICLCKGTSRVYTFPTLRKVCPQQINHRYLDGMPESDNYSEDGAVCSTCRGRGWVVEALLEDLLVIAEQSGYELTVGHNFAVVVVRRQGMKAGTWGQDGTPMEAASLALVAAAQAQEEKQSDLV